MRVQIPTRVISCGPGHLVVYNTLQHSLGWCTDNCILDLHGNREVFVQFLVKFGDVSLPRVGSRRHKANLSLSVGGPYLKLSMKSSVHGFCKLWKHEFSVSGVTPCTELSHFTLHKTSMSLSWIMIILSSHVG